MKHLDLFSGIGGFSLAASWFGITTTQFVEIDPYCQKVLQKNFPNIPIHDDITTFTATQGQFDVITAGFPCQDISAANSVGRGLEGERSGLFFEVVRLIRTIQPRFVLLENVPNLFKRGFDRLLWELSECGFNAEWQTISSASVGSPHLRERLFIVAYPEGQRSARHLTNQERTNQAPLFRDTFWKQNPHPEPSIHRMDARVSKGLDRVRALGNSVNPYCAAIAFQRIMEIDKMMTTIEAPKELTITYLNLSDLQLDGATQQRAKINLTHVQTLEDALSESENLDLEPIEVIQEGETYWVVDGFHRILAYKHLGRPVIPAKATEGTLRDAILASVAANAENLALPRTRADKNKAVKTLLLDTEWSLLSDLQISKIAKVSDKTVTAIRKSLVRNSELEPTDKVATVTNGNGTTYQRTIKAKPNNQYKDGDYRVKKEPNVNEWTARDGHLVPKSRSEEMEIPLEESPLPEPEPLPKAKVISIDLREIFLGFMSNYENFPTDYKLAVKKRIAEIDELTAIAI